MAQMRSETKLEEGEFVSNRRRIAYDEQSKAIENSRGHERRIDRVMPFEDAIVRGRSASSLTVGDMFE